MVWRSVGPKAGVCLVLVIVSVALAAGTSPARAFDSAENKSTSTGGSLRAPFGLHTDDLDAMVKRRNIRALVLINPIGFFYDNGKPMGIMYDALSALQIYVNQKFKTCAVKVEISFIPVRPDQVEAALAQGVGDFVAYALVVTPQRQQHVAFTVPRNQCPAGSHHRAELRRSCQSGRSHRQRDLRKSINGAVSVAAASKRKAAEDGKAAHHTQTG